jgi:hypothetical protein
MFEPGDAALVACRLGHLGGSAEAKPRLPACLLRRHPLAHETLGEQVNVGGQLLGEGRVVAAAADERAELGQEV